LHVRHGVPNQDAINWSPREGSAPAAVMAVADGHGSNRCFRSKTGAAIAVSVGFDLLTGVITDGGGEEQAPAWLPRRLADGWSEAVAADLARTPFTPAELGHLEDKEGPAARRELLAGPALAYGTTLMLAGANERGVLVLQVGDGDILTVSDAGVVARPLPPDPHSVGNATASLARASAGQDARVGWLPATTGELPALVLASTDGYANSFEDDAGFLQVGSDLLGIVRAEGLGLVAGELAGWLGEASELGSGDDISVGLLVAGE
jgi:hypothetical protein